MIYANKTVTFPDFDTAREKLRQAKLFVAGNHIAGLPPLEWGIIMTDRSYNMIDNGHGSYMFVTGLGVLSIGHNIVHALVGDPLPKNYKLGKRGYNYVAQRG